MVNVFKLLVLYKISAGSNIPILPTGTVEYLEMDQGNEDYDDSISEQNKPVNYPDDHRHIDQKEKPMAG